MAKQYEVTLRTLRFYEGIGLLQPKRKGATRLYSHQDCHRLQMILRGKQLGLSLSEIGNLILPGNKNVKVTDIESTLSAEQIILQIGHLERQREEVEKAIVALRIADERIKNKATA